MICHIALYRLRRGTPAAAERDFIAALAEATDETGLARDFACGPHVRLPADDAVPRAVYSLGATWSFEDQSALDAFSQHPAMTAFVARWARSLVADLAFVNFELEAGR
jgi:hypothetical protein